MQKKVQINNESIESIVKKDYKEALVEYVLNAFEANASEVQIVSIPNKLGGLEEIQIIDNGTGINHNTLSKTFESFLSSSKAHLQKPIDLGRNKGRGRYSFIGFATSATWQTTYRDSDRLFSYTITIHAIQKDYVEFDETVKDVTDETSKTGTIVTLHGINSLVIESMDFSQLESPLLNAFAWFLYLKRSKCYTIVINGQHLDYSKLIDTELSGDSQLQIDNFLFNVSFLKWIDNIKSKYFFYFLDEQSRKQYQKHTKYNNNAIEFCHSVYIESAYFNDFVALDAENNSPEDQLIVGESDSKNERSPTFKTLLSNLNDLVKHRLKLFVKKDADHLIEKMEDQGGFPKFGCSAFELQLKEDLVTVVKEIYCVEPRIFKGLKKESQKSILGFLKLLISTDERENVITIIEEIIDLSQEERADLTATLKHTKLSNIVRTIKLLTDRLQIIELLKTMIYDNQSFSNERDHIQTVIQKNYWLFGEEFYLVTADKSFERALTEYLYVIDASPNESKYLKAAQDKLRRPDIFICQKRMIENVEGSQLEQNIIVELKAPHVVLNKKIHRQIEDYMDFILNQPVFNSQARDWKFIAVCKSVDDNIKALYKSLESHNKRFLTHKVANYELYSMTWDDVFTSYTLRYSHLLKKLDVDKDILLEKFNFGVPSRATANDLRDQILSLSEV